MGSFSRLIRKTLFALHLPDVREWKCAGKKSHNKKASKQRLFLNPYHLVLSARLKALSEFGNAVSVDGQALDDLIALRHGGLLMTAVVLNLDGDVLIAKLL